MAQKSIVQSEFGNPDRNSSGVGRNGWVGSLLPAPTQPLPMAVSARLALPSKSDFEQRCSATTAATAGASGDSAPRLSATPPPVLGLSPGALLKQAPRPPSYTPSGPE